MVEAIPGLMAFIVRGTRTGLTLHQQKDGAVENSANNGKLPSTVAMQQALCNN